MIGGVGRSAAAYTQAGLSALVDGGREKMATGPCCVCRLTGPEKD